jgi:hypothetical protein
MNIGEILLKNKDRIYVASDREQWRPLSEKPVNTGILQQTGLS